MKKRHDPEELDTKQASSLIAVLSLIGLTTCFVVAAFRKIPVPIWVFAIFGGGILGTDNILKIIRAVFRINDER